MSIYILIGYVRSLAFIFQVKCDSLVVKLCFLFLFFYRADANKHGNLLKKKKNTRKHELN